MVFIELSQSFNFVLNLFLCIKTIMIFIEENNLLNKALQKMLESQ